MASVGSVAVDFLANTKGFVEGLKIIESKTTSAMASVSTQIDRADASAETLGNTNKTAAKQAEQGWKKATDQIGQFEQETTSAGSAVQQLADSIVQIGSSLALGAIISDASKAAREYENFAMQMKVLLGNADEAQKVIQDLNKFSLDTPFSPEQVQKAGRALLSFGITTDKLIPSLQKLGDLALGTGSDFNELATIYGKARVAGTLFAEDINVFTERGIPVVEAFAKVLGVSADQVKKMGSEGKISFDILNQALADTEGPLAKFNGMTSEAAKTTDGMLSSLGGNIDEFKKSLGEFYNSVLTPMVEALLEITNAIIAWAKENPVLAETLRDVIAVTIALGAAILGGAGLIAGFSLLKTGIASATAAVQAFAAAQTTAASGAAARWAAILGPFALVAAGVFAITYTINFVERRRVETEETQVGMAGAAALLTKGEERKQLVGLLTEYKSKLDALSKAQKATVGDTRNLDEALKSQVDSLKQTVNQIANVNVNQTVLADSLRISTVTTDDLTRASRALTQAQIALKNETKKPANIAPKGEEDKLKDLKDEIRKTAQEYDYMTNAQGAYVAKSEAAIKSIGNNKKELQDLLKVLKSVNKQYQDQNQIIVKSHPAYSEHFGVIGNIADSYKNIKLVTGDLKDSITEVFGKKITEGARQFAQGLSFALETLVKIGPEVAKFNEVLGQLGNVNADNTRKQIQAISMAYEKFYADQLKDQVAAIDAQEKLQLDPIEAQIKSYETQIKALDDANKQKLLLIKQYEQEKNDIINKSNGELSEENRKRFEAEVQRINFEYQLKIENIKRSSADVLQAQIIEQELLKSAEAEKASLLEYYKEVNKQQIQEQVDAKQAQIDTIQNEVDANEAAQESITNLLSTAMAEQTRIQEEANKKRQDAEDAHAKNMEEIRKNTARAEYLNTLAQFKMNKDLQKAQLGIQMAMLAAQMAAGVAVSFAQGGLVGAAAAAALSTALLAVTVPAYNISLATIDAQTPPLPPPEIFADGGMVGGNLHSRGGTLIEAERGEFVINRQSTMDNLGLLQAINDGRDIGGNTINLAVTNNISGVNDVEAIAEQIGFSIMQKVKSANYRFA